MNIMNFSKTMLYNLFHKPVTRPYPQQPRQYPQRTRGRVDIDIDTCVFCGLCEKKCPAGAIMVNRGDKTWAIERFGCIQCGACVESCNKGSLSMSQGYTKPDTEKTVDTFAQAPKEEGKEITAQKQ